MDNPNITATSPAPARLLRDRKGRPYEPAIGPALRVLLYFLFISFAVLGATAIYLTSIRAMEEIKGQFYQSLFSLWMFSVHQWIGVAFVVPFFVFGLFHLATARRRKNRLAIRLGILLFITGSLVVVSGLALMQIPSLPQLPTGDVSTLGAALPLRAIVLWLHGLLPLAAVWIYVLHRRAGPAIKWRYGYAWGVAVAAFVGAMLYMHSHDPRKWYAQGSPEGEKYFEPSRARTVDAKFIPAQVLMADDYCLKCHADIYKSHLHSAHRFSSFNNPAYLFSVRETRQRMGVRASRWCAGCHDPVPFFSGQFDDPNFDDVKNPTAHAGITCTTCHSMTHINSRSGNGDYTIEEPIHYPFAFSEDPVLGWVNEQLIKAKPEFHKRTFLKPFHRTAEFCSVCHKVGVPQEVNHYKEFLRGQNHPDSYHLSGVSGHGARSFYYPKQAKTTCAQCHMPLLQSEDFGARDFDGSGKRKVHSHLFPAANTGVPGLVKYRSHEDVIAAHEKFLQGGPDGQSPPLRIDLFGLKQLTAQHPGVDAPLIDDKPLRPNLPMVQPGGTYLVEVVVRTLNMGHHFTQGTADSNEVWVDFQVRARSKGGTRLLARNGGMDSGEDSGRVDPWAHFLNVLMLDRHGNRIDRRNPQDIFTPLYDHQIPPGAAAVVHYRVEVPRDLKPGESVELSARVRYRKFDHRYMEIIHGADRVPKLPIVDLCSDRVELPVAGVTEKVPPQESPIKPAWQRWNDYGIGCFLEGGPDGKKGGELAQAERSFKRLVDASGEFRDVKEAHGHGWLNLARVHLAYAGVERLDLARQALSQARQSEPPAPWQTVAWFNGLVDLENANLDEAIDHFKTILDPKNRDRKRGFDFTQDFVVINKLAQTYFLRSRGAEPDSQDERQDLLAALAEFEKTLQLDPDNVEAHEFLNKCYGRLGGKESLAPGVREETSKSETRLLNLVDTLAARDRPSQRRLDAARDLATLARQLDERPRFEVLLSARQRAWSAAKATEDPWLRSAAVPALRELDRRILAALAGLAKTFADSDQESTRRLQAAADLAAGLAAIEERPPPADVRSPLLTAASFPRPGLPVNLTLAALADGGQLQGPLAQPRLLTLYAIRRDVYPLFTADGDHELQRAAARVLGRVHLTMHGIFKPDDNASGLAVEIYRRRHPPAAQASQSIVIYPAHPGGRPPRP